MGNNTPGPWRHETVFDQRGNPCAYSVWPCNQSGGRNRICMTPDGTTCENLSNAQLIAAAPDLLAALKLAKEYVDGTIGFSGERENTLSTIRAAIRKAEGES